MEVLFKAGLQVPFIPLVEIVGNGNKDSPLHIEAILLNIGFLTAKISTFLVTKSVHPQLVSTLSVTVYTPGEGYVWRGFCSLLVVPSPNTQEYFTNSELSTFTTLERLVKDVLLPKHCSEKLKSATGLG